MVVVPVLPVMVMFRVVVFVPVLAIPRENIAPRGIVAPRVVTALRVITALRCMTARRATIASLNLIGAAEVSLHLLRAGKIPLSLRPTAASAVMLPVILFRAITRRRQSQTGCRDRGEEE